MDSISRVVFAGGKADVISANPQSLISKDATNAIQVSDELFFKGDEHILGKFSILAVIEILTVLMGKDKV